MDQVVENPHQPRSAHDPDSSEELAASIREHGVLQPLLVTQVGLDDQGRPRYQLIAGERRWRAARSAELAEVPVMVKEVTPAEILSLALVENIQREDLNGARGRGRLSTIDRRVRFDPSRGGQADR